MANLSQDLAANIGRFSDVSAQLIESYLLLQLNSSLAQGSRRLLALRQLQVSVLVDAGISDLLSSSVRLNAVTVSAYLVRAIQQQTLTLNRTNATVPEQQPTVDFLGPPPAQHSAVVVLVLVVDGPERDAVPPCRPPLSRCRRPRRPLRFPDRPPARPRPQLRPRLPPLSGRPAARHRRWSARPLCRRPCPRPRLQPHRPHPPLQRCWPRRRPSSRLLRRQRSLQLSHHRAPPLPPLPRPAALRRPLSARPLCPCPSNRLLLQPHRHRPPQQRRRMPPRRRR